ncbi:MAG TPA: hypothetical protein VGE51_08555 [Fontimonas sp.]
MAAACGLVMLAATATTAWASEPRYRLREVTGAHVGRTAATSRVPLKLTYAELSAQDRERLRADYEDMPAADEPPYPKDGVIALVKGYTQVQRAASLSGRFRAAVHIDESGIAQSIAIYETPDPRLSTALAAAAMAPPYKPGRCAGRPCAMDFPVDVIFAGR